MSGEPPQGGPKVERIPAAVAQPKLEKEVEERLRLFKSIEHITGVKAENAGPVLLLPYVDPGAFSKPPENIPKRMTEDYRKMEAAVNAPEVLPYLLDRLGFLARIPRSGKIKLNKAPWPAKDEAKQKTWENEVRERIQLVREAGNSDMAQNQEEALEKFLADARHGKKVNVGRLQFLNQNNVDAFRNAIGRGLNPKFYAVMHYLKQEGFAEQVIPSLQSLALKLTQQIQEITDIKDIPPAQLELARQYAVYILSRVGEEHTATSQGWQTRLANILVIAATYNVAGLSLTFEQQGELRVPHVHITNVPHGGERFLRFVLHYMTAPAGKRSNFPENDPVTAGGFDRKVMEEPQNPAFLIMNALNLQSSEPPQTSERMQGLNESLEKRHAERAEIRKSELAFIPTITSKSFSDAVNEYVQLRRTKERGYDVHPIFKRTIEAMRPFAEPTEETLDLVHKQLAASARDATYKGRKLPIQQLRYVMTIALSAEAEAATRGIAFASARIIIDSAQRSLMQMKHTLEIYGAALGNNPVLSALQQKALKDVAALQEKLTEMTSQVDMYFAEVDRKIESGTMGDMDVIDPLKTRGADMEIVRWKDYKKRSEERKKRATKPISPAEMQKRVDMVMKDPKKNFATALLIILEHLQVPGYTQEGKRNSFAHAVNMLDALHKGLSDNEKSLDAEQIKYKKLLDIVLVPLRTMRQALIADPTIRTLPSDSKVTSQILEALYKQLR